MKKIHTALLRALAVMALAVGAFAQTPAITSISPAALHTTASSLALTVNGPELGGGVVYVDGVKEPTSTTGPVGAKYLVATLPAGFAANPAAHNVQVLKPLTGLQTNTVQLSVLGPVSVSVTAPATTMPSGQTLQFTASVTNYLSDASVTFSVSGPGSIDPVSGVYSPGNLTSDTQATVTATSNEDPTKSASMTVTVLAVPDPTSENFYCGKGDVWLGAATDGPASLPQHCIYTGVDGTPSPGNTILVPAGADPNAALASASCGDTILLTAGASYPYITLPAKNCDINHWITIRTSAPDSALPPEHQRINPSYAGVASLQGRPAYSGGTSNVMAQIMATAGIPSISTATGANFYRIGPGLELTRPQGIKIVYNAVMLRDGDHIILDRDWIHGSPVVGEEDNHGVVFTGATNVAVVNSYINDFKCYVNHACSDAQAISGGDTIIGHPEGTWKGYNNFLEGAAENILHGGGGTGDQTPTDLEYRQNHMFKPLWWMSCTANGQPCPIVKNLFELKNAKRVLLEGNRMEYSWGGYTQNGHAILLTPRGSWAHVEDVTIRDNYVSHTGSIFVLADTTKCSVKPVAGVCNGTIEEALAGNWSIHDILMDDINKTTYNGTATTEILSESQVNPPLHDVKLDHLTLVTDGVEGFIFTLFSEPNPAGLMGPLTVTNSIIRAGSVADIISDGQKPACVTTYNDPIQSFQQCFNAANVNDNLIVSWTKKYPWPAGQLFAPDFTTVFVNPQLFGGDYHVLAPYKNAGTDGRDLGADIDTIMKLVQNIQ